MSDQNRDGENSPDNDTDRGDEARERPVEERPLRWAPSPSAGGQRILAPSAELPGGPGEPVAPQGIVPPAPSWERIEEIGFWAALLRSIGEILFRPGETFSRMPRRAALGWPLLFLLIVGTFGMAVTAVYEHVFRAFSPEARAQYEQILQRAGLPEITPAVERFLLLLQIAVWPFVLMLGAFIGAGITHLFLLLFGGARHGFATTFRTLCYVWGAVQVWAILPVVGPYLVMPVWSLVCVIVGLTRSHETSAGRVAAAVLLPGVILACCLLAALLFLIQSVLKDPLLEALF